MRKSVKQQLALRVLSTAALMAMASSIATAAFADTYDLNKGSVDILAEDGKQYITQWADKDKSTAIRIFVCKWNKCRLLPEKRGRTVYLL